MGLKRLFLKMATIGLGIGLMTSAAFAANLRVLAWDGYADADWVKDFTAKTGIGVDVVFIGSDDEIWVHQMNNTYELKAHNWTLCL